MNPISKYFLNKKYDFFRNYIEVKNKLNCYSDLDFNIFTADEKTFRENYIPYRVAKIRSIFALNSLEKTCRSVKNVKPILENIEEEFNKK
jgi:hypothetical protein